MAEQRRPQLRLYLTGLVTLAELANLTWEHLHGGVVSHHILHRAEMPAISNWWGLLVLPVLTWFVIGRIQRRMAPGPGGTEVASKLPPSVVVGFALSLLAGILLSVAFTTHHESIASHVFEGILLLAVLLPVYRAECLLGFVLGMTITFGAVLPAVFGSAVAALSAAVHRVLRPLLVRLWKSLKRTRSGSA